MTAVTRKHCLSTAQLICLAFLSFRAVLVQSLEGGTLAVTDFFLGCFQRKGLTRM